VKAKNVDEVISVDKQVGVLNRKLMRVKRTLMKAKRTLMNTKNVDVIEENGDGLKNVGKKSRRILTKSENVDEIEEVRRPKTSARMPLKILVPQLHCNGGRLDAQDVPECHPESTRSKRLIQELLCRVPSYCNLP
jgi:hypothetical protein